MSWNKDIILSFIDKYRSLECLWKIKSRDYSNKHKKEEAYKELIEYMQLLDNTTTRDMITKKINNLRTAYRKELKKVQDSMRSGVGTEQVYTPTLWYFDYLSFLYEQEIPRKGVSSAESQLELTQTEDDDTFNADVSENMTQDEQEYNTDSPAISDASFSPNPCTSRALSPNTSASLTTPARKNGKRKVTNNTSEELMSQISAKLRSVEPDDEYDVFGKHIGAQIRKLENQQKILAMKLINDVLFEAQMNNLTRNAILATTVHMSENDANGFQMSESDANVFQSCG